MCESIGTIHSGLHSAWHRWIMYGLVIATQSPLLSTRIMYCVSPMCAGDPWTWAPHPTLDSLFHGLRLVWMIQHRPRTMQAPDYDIVSYDGLCVCCVFNLRVAFQSMKAPVYRLPGSPPPPPPPFSFRDFKLRFNKMKPCAPLDSKCVYEHAQAMGTSLSFNKVALITHGCRFTNTHTRTHSTILSTTEI